MLPKQSAEFQMRFAAKRLRRIIDGTMNDAKRAIIRRTAFKDLLNISGFAAPMDLIEFVAVHTNSKLREFRYKGKAIVFTREMVRKVLSVPCGSRPMDMLKRSQPSELRDMYKNEKGRTTIARATHILKTCADTDEDTVVQSFGLIAFGTVLNPGTGNTVRCEYLASLMDINAIDQYSIDEHILAEAMDGVDVFKEKLNNCTKVDDNIPFLGSNLPMLAIIYMDHLSFPPLAPDVHTINYSIPRFCYVVDADFELVASIDKQKLSLSAYGDRPLLPLHETLYAPVTPTNAPPPQVNPPKEGDNQMGSEEAEVNPSASLNEWLEKGLPTSQDLQVPPHLAGLYNKHKDLYREEVDGAIKICKQEVDGVLKNFGLALMGVHTKRMAALLVDVHAANESSSSFTLPCHLSSTEAAAADAPPQGKAKEASPTKAPEVHPLETGSPSKVQQDGAENVVMGSPARNDYSPNYVPTPRKSVPAGYWDDIPSMELFPPGSKDAELFASIPEVVPTAVTCGGSSGFATPPRTKTSVQEAEETINVSSGPSTHDMHNRHKRKAKEPESPSKMKKLRVTGTDAEVYRKFISHNRKLKTYDQTEEAVPFVQIGNFYVSYEHFYETFKPRQWMGTEVMSLYVEKFNIDNQSKNKIDKRLIKKFAFTVSMTKRLIVDPAKFETKDVMEEFKSACANNPIPKQDLLWFPILHDKHWATCCINILFQEIDSFDSMKTTKKGGSMEIAINNLITNFAAVAKEAKVFNFDVTKLKRGGPSKYPQQPNNFDCGFFVPLYWDNFDGKVMKMFDEKGIPSYRRILAAEFIKHPMNTEDSAKVLEEELQ